MYIDENDIRTPRDRAPESDMARYLLDNTRGRNRLPAEREELSRVPEPMPRTKNDMPPMSDMSKTPGVPQMPESSLDCRGDYRLTGFPLAMVYSPVQNWQNLYDEEKGFTRGTIFAELDKPFEGRRRI